MSSRRSASKRPARRPTQVDVAFVERAALSYLERFDATAAKLREVLLRRCQTAIRSAPSEASRGEVEIHSWVSEVIERYERSGILDDRRYAANAADSLRRRGSSRRKIVGKLRQKGVAEGVILEVLAQQEEQDPGQELAAAIALARRRRLGPYGRGERSPEHRRKDLAVLARAGFSFDVAVRALAPEGEEF